MKLKKQKQMIYFGVLLMLISSFTAMTPISAEFSTMDINIGEELIYEIFMDSEFGSETSYLKLNITAIINDTSIDLTKMIYDTFQSDNPTTWPSTPNDINAECPVLSNATLMTSAIIDSPELPTLFITPGMQIGNLMSEITPALIDSIGYTVTGTSINSNYGVSFEYTDGENITLLTYVFNEEGILAFSEWIYNAIDDSDDLILQFTLISSSNDPAEPLPVEEHFVEPGVEIGDELIYEVLLDHELDSNQSYAKFNITNIINDTSSGLTTVIYDTFQSENTTTWPSTPESTESESPVLPNSTLFAMAIIDNGVMPGFCISPGMQIGNLISEITPILTDSFGYPVSGTSIYAGNGASFEFTDGKMSGKITHIYNENGILVFSEFISDAIDDFDDVLFQLTLISINDEPIDPLPVEEHFVELGVEIGDELIYERVMDSEMDSDLSYIKLNITNIVNDTGSGFTIVIYDTFLSENSTSWPSTPESTDLESAVLPNSTLFALAIIDSVEMPGYFITPGMQIGNLISEMTPTLTDFFGYPVSGTSINDGNGASFDFTDGEDNASISYIYNEDGILVFSEIIVEAIHDSDDIIYQFTLISINDEPIDPSPVEEQFVEPGIEIGDELIYEISSIYNSESSLQYAKFVIVGIINNPITGLTNVIFDIYLSEDPTTWLSIPDELGVQWVVLTNSIILKEAIESNSVIPSAFIGPDVRIGNFASEVASLLSPYFGVTVIGLSTNNTFGLQLEFSTTDQNIVIKYVYDENGILLTSEHMVDNVDDTEDLQARFTLISINDEPIDSGSTTTDPTTTDTTTTSTTTTDTSGDSNKDEGSSIPGYLHFEIIFIGCVFLVLRKKKIMVHK